MTATFRVNASSFPNVFCVFFSIVLSSLLPMPALTKTNYQYCTNHKKIQIFFEKKKERKCELLKSTLVVGYDRQCTMYIRTQSLSVLQT